MDWRKFFGMEQTPIDKIVEDAYKIPYEEGEVECLQKAEEAYRNAIQYDDTLRLVVGKRRPEDEREHAWLERIVNGEIKIIDPTNNVMEFPREGLFSGVRPGWYQVNPDSTRYWFNKLKHEMKMEKLRKWP